LKIISAETNLFYQSNALRSNTQTFTSFISDQKNFIFLDEHLNRLLLGADYLFPKENWFNFLPEITNYLKKEFVPSHYFRISIYDDQLIFLKKPHVPKDPFISLGKAKSLKTPTIIPSFVKNGNYLLSDLEIKESKYGDVLFFDPLGNLTEASTSNIFVLLDEKTILTPKTSSMVLSGVVRKKLIEFFKCKNINVQECDISSGELESAQEVWLTNSIQGIRLVDNFEKVSFVRDNNQYQDICFQFGRFGERFSNEKSITS
jgi:branched-chain amino acid aminotransferase